MLPPRDQDCSQRARRGLLRSSRWDRRLDSTENNLSSRRRAPARAETRALQLGPIRKLRPGHLSANGEKVPGVFLLMSIKYGCFHQVSDFRRFGRLGRLHFRAVHTQATEKQGGWTAWTAWTAHSLSGFKKRKKERGLREVFALPGQVRVTIEKGKGLFLSGDTLLTQRGEGSSSLKLSP